MIMNNMMIVVIVPFGYSENVIQAAHKAGATGSTILRGRGATGLKESPLSFKIDPEEEVILITVPEEIMETVCNTINEQSKDDSITGGTLFVLPVIN